MADYENGKIPRSLLRRVSNFVPLYSGVTSDAGSDLLREDAWAALNMLQVAFRQALGRSLNVSEAYRGLTRQTAVWQIYKGGGPMAAPVGHSNHGWAVSCDFGSGVATYGSVAKVWMDANAPAYGWWPSGNGFAKREAWHFDYRPGTGTIVIPSGGGATPFPETEDTTPATPDEREIMSSIIITGSTTGNDAPFLFDTERQTRRPINAVTRSIMNSAGVPEVTGITQAQFDGIRVAPANEGQRLLILFGSSTGQAYPYVYNAETGLRHSIDSNRLSIMRSGGLGIPEINVSQGALDGIPKAAGSA